MSTHNICFFAEIRKRKVISGYPLVSGAMLRCLNILGEYGITETVCARKFTTAKDYAGCVSLYIIYVCLVLQRNECV